MPQAKTFDLGLEFIEANAAADEWFLQIETFDPHEPFFSQPEFRAMSAAAHRPLAPPPLSATLERHAATGPVPSLLPWPLPPVATLHAHTHHNTHTHLSGWTQVPAQLLGPGVRLAAVPRDQRGRWPAAAIPMENPDRSCKLTRQLCGQRRRSSTSVTCTQRS